MSTKKQLFETYIKKIVKQELLNSGMIETLVKSEVKKILNTNQLKETTVTKNRTFIKNNSILNSLLNDTAQDSIAMSTFKTNFSSQPNIDKQTNINIDVPPINEEKTFTLDNGITVTESKLPENLQKAFNTNYTDMLTKINSKAQKYRDKN